MRTATWALLGTTVLATATLQLVPGAPSPAAVADVPSLAVAGGARMYPAYSPATSRYAVHPAPDGSVRVEVTGAAEVWFDGVPDPDGTATWTDVAPGEEISVFVGSGSSRRTLALYVLPAGFPTLAAESTGAPLEPGNLALTLDNLTNGVSPRFEAVVDRNGVPVYTRGQSIRALDLKLAANGHFTVHRPTTTPGRTGGALVELDDRFQELRRFETTGLVDTDDHDSRLMPDGSRWLIAYEPNATTGLVDSVIQHVGPGGDLLWQWTSAPYAGETMLPGKADYAHINSIDVQPDGDVLASFRNLSSVYLIRPGTGGGPGEVVWKLGGRDSDFTFPALPDGSADGGPCAQHSASLLPNGNVLVFDNGSHPFFGTPLCVDPQDPLGPTVERAWTRVVELALAGGTATPVRTYGDTDRFAWFMGSAAKMPGGGVLIGWSSAPDSIASETDAQGATLWRLRDTRAPVDGTVPKPYITYRVARVPARDGFDPEVVVDAPPDGATVTQGAEVPLAFSCTDRGGSTLQACDGPVGRRLDTAVPGAHTWTVTARDGSGRTTTRTRTYTVLAAPAPAPTPTPTPGPATPDLALRVPGARWTGAGTSYPAAQDLRARVRPGRVLRATMRVTNAGASPGRFLLRAPSAGARDLRVRWTYDGVRRTRALEGDGWRTPVLAPGESLRLAVRVVVAPAAEAGRHVLRVAAASPSGLRDRARLLVRIRTM
jgi:hypothetical protein